MNLGRVKSFLIYLFLAINIYLVVSLVLSSTFRIDNATVDNTVKILSDSNVSIDKEIIPKKVKNLKNIEAKNIIYTEKPIKHLGKRLKPQRNPKLILMKQLRMV